VIWIRSIRKNPLHSHSEWFHHQSDQSQTSNTNLKSNLSNKMKAAKQFRSHLASHSACLLIKWMKTPKSCRLKTKDTKVTRAKLNLTFLRPNNFKKTLTTEMKIKSHLKTIFFRQNSSVVCSCTNSFLFRPFSESLLCLNLVCIVSIDDRFKRWFVAQTKHRPKRTLL
jgi:hypothetical protein